MYLFWHSLASETIKHLTSITWKHLCNFFKKKLTPPPGFQNSTKWIKERLESIELCKKKKQTWQKNKIFFWLPHISIKEMIIIIIITDDSCSVSLTTSYLHLSRGNDNYTHIPPFSAQVTVQYEAKYTTNIHIAPFPCPLMRTYSIL